jgi:hypothetical protein
MLIVFVFPLLIGLLLVEPYVSFSKLLGAPLADRQMVLYSQGRDLWHAKGIGLH